MVDTDPITSEPPAVEASNPDGQPVTSRHAPTHWIYRNLTPYRILASYDANRSLVTPRSDGDDPRSGAVAKMLSIPALGEAVIPHEDAREFETLTMRRLGQLELRPAPSCLSTNLPRGIVIFGWLAVAVVTMIRALLFGGNSGVAWRWCIAVVIVVPVIALLVATWRELHLYLRFGRYRTESSRRGISLEGVERGSRIRSFVDGAPRQLAEKLVFACAVVIAVVGLGVAIQLTTQLNGLLPIDGRALSKLDNPFVNLDDATRNSPAFWQLLVGHVAQWVLVSVAAIVPAAMYFQFDRQRLSAVQRQWIRDVFRLDPTVRTVRDIEAKYGSQIEASFGNVDPDSGLRLGRGRRSPIIVATVLNVVGWFLLVSTTNVPRLAPATGADGVVEWRWPGDETFPVSTFFAPQLTLVGYAFLGSYVFAVLYTIRGYQRRDLQPKTYNTIVARILTAYALALVMSVVYDGRYAEVVMFFVGFTPQSALVWLREKVSSRGFTLIPLHEPAPLTELEGIDLYDRTRLAEEGVNNVEALAHADIIDLMSSTRIPAAELVDWTDQAILYLKVGGDASTQFRASDDRSEREACSPHEHVPDVRLNLCHLRCFGIRTATDLMKAYRQAERRGHGDPAACSQELEAICTALALPSGPQHAEVSPVQTVIDTLTDEEWFSQVQNWHDSEFAAPDAWYRYLDGHDWSVQTMTGPASCPVADATMDTVPGIADLRPPLRIVNRHGDDC